MIYCRHIPSLALLSIFLSCSFSSAFLCDIESDTRRYQLTAEEGDPLLVDIQLRDINFGNSTDLSKRISLAVGVPYTGDFGDHSQISSHQYSIRILQSFTERWLGDFSIPQAPPPSPTSPSSTSSTVSGGPSMSSAQNTSIPTPPPPRPEPGPGIRLSTGGLVAIILSTFLFVVCLVALFLCWRRNRRLRRHLSPMGSTTRVAATQPYANLGSESTLVVNLEEANKSKILSQSSKAVGDEDAPLSRTEFLKRERDRINQQLEMLEGRVLSDHPDPLKQTGEGNILFQIDALKDQIQVLEARQVPV
ncbi:hypothetical protein M413DRAFT_273781 [Hebeloma cylindrosporum]|uniref:GOLD domain-containing protein n=1 Tax=Hebeloma cylindrosporum TaxID=76867 RepID=A0A0C3C139_HEBCY|nr:hypothetical protein M413DRAFT_273781 [Hebeloma cylindrosporum h7]